MHLKHLAAKTFLVLTIIALTTATVAAEENNADIDALDSTDVWLNDDMEEFEAVCHEDEIEELKVEEKTLVSSEDETNETLVTTDMIQEVSVGTHEVVLDCEESELTDTTDKEFSFIDITEVSINNDLEGFEQARLGEGHENETSQLELGLEIEEMENSTGFASENMSFNFNGLTEETPSNDNGTLLMSPRVEEDVGNHTVNKLNITVNERTFEYEFEEVNLEVKPAWEVEILEEGYPRELFLTYDDLRSLSYELDLKHRGETSTEEMANTIFEDKFYAEMGGHSGNWYNLPGSQADDENGVYNITLDSRPDLSTGSYELVTYLDVDEGKYEIDRVDVLQSMLFEGQIEDTNNRGVESYMEILDDGIRETIDVGSNGEFSERLDPVVTGEIDDALIYDNIEIGFGDHDDPTSILYASNVNLSDNEGALRYNYEHDANNVEEDGMNPVNKMSMEFGYPMEDPKVRMAFDPDRVDPEDVRVFECNNWNFFGQECRSDEWNTISESDVEIRRGQTYYAEFPVEPYTVPDGDHHAGQDIINNAYVIGTTADLDLNDYALSISGVQDESVVINEDIEFRGRVIDENNNEIPNADVEVTLRTTENEYTYEGTTDELGNFEEVSGEAPGSAGQYTVTVTVDKTNYNSFTHTYDNRLEAYVEEGVRISFPEVENTVDLRPGEETETEVVIENIGQKEVTDVNLNLGGDDTEYADISESRFSVIDPESEETFTLSMELPEDFQESNYPSFDISAEGNSNGEEVDYTNTLYTTVVDTSPVENDTEESETEEETETESSTLAQEIEDFEQATGEFVASQSSLNLALGLIMVFAMVLAAAVKKNNDEDHSSRGRPHRDLNRPRIEKPNLSGSDSRVEHVKPENSVDDAIEDMGGEDDEEVDSVIDEIAEEVEDSEKEDSKDSSEDSSEDSEKESSQESEDEDSEDSITCDVCGESFDTESGKKLHEQALH